MSRFAPALRRLARELEMPSGARSAFLLEVASDLDAVFEHHRARGASEGEAMRRAEEAVLGSSEVLRRVSRLHQGPWRGVADAIAERVAGGIERILLVGGVLPAALLGVGVAGWALRAGESGVVWGLLAVGAGMAWVGIPGFVRLRRGRRRGRGRRPRARRPLGDGRRARVPGADARAPGRGRGDRRPGAASIPPTPMFVSQAMAPNSPTVRPRTRGRPGRVGSPATRRSSSRGCSSGWPGC